MCFLKFAIVIVIVIVSSLAMVPAVLKQSSSVTCSFLWLNPGSRDGVGLAFVAAFIDTADTG